MAAVCYEASASKEIAGADYSRDEMVDVGMGFKELNEVVEAPCDGCELINVGIV